LTYSRKVSQTLQRGIAVLEFLRHSRHAHSPREIAEATSLDRTVTYRILRTLELDALVVLRDDGRYELGPRVALLGFAYLHYHPLRNASLPHLYELLFQRFAGEPWMLHVMERVESEISVVSQILSPTMAFASLMALPPIVPIEHTPTGQCILAFMPPDQVAALIGKKSALALASTLQRIRKTGFIWVSSTEDPLLPPELEVIATPILGRSGAPLGALSVAGSGLNQHASAQSLVVLNLISTAEKIGRTMP